MDAPKMEQFWDEQQSSGHGHAQSNGHSASAHGNYERNLNFSTVTVEDGEYGFPKKKTVRDPLSHRIIEKRRRDRMNNCLADLARLLPPSSLRKGRGRIEKTEIVELAIKHLKHLQCHPCPNSDNCEYNQIPLPRATHSKSSTGYSGGSPTSSSSSGTTPTGQTTGETRAGEEQFRLGFQESTSETMHFLVEKEGMYPGDGLCVRLVQHLNSHCDSLLRDDIGNNRKLTLGLNGSSRPFGPGKKVTGRGGSISSGYQPNGSSGSGSDGNGTNGSNPKSGGMPSGATPDSGNIFDLEGDQNSCSSAPLSLDITDAFSIDGKMTGRSQTKPPLPTIICSHSSSNNSCTCKLTNSSASPPVHTASSSNSDEGHSGSSSAAHRYKFKNNIKQRFTADLIHTEDEGPGDGDKAEQSPAKSRKHDKSTYKFPPSNTSQSLTETDSPSQYPSPGEEAEMTFEPDPEEDDPRKLHASPASAEAEDILHTSNTPSKILKGEAIPLEGGQMLVKVATTLASPFPSPILASTRLAGQLLDPEKGQHAPETVGSPEPLDLDQKPFTLPIVATVSDGKIKALCAPPKGIPAFALHEKGLYYIPLTIDPAILAPFIAAMDPASQPPLHPVTISVCFLLNSDAKKLTDFPPSPTIPLTAIPTSIRARVSDIVSVDLTKAQHHHNQAHHGSKRESREFIMNRFTQSQVPMIFGSPLPSHEYHPLQQFSQEAIPNLLPTPASNRLFPVAVVGRGGSISSSSSSSQQSSTYFNPNHKQHSPIHSSSRPSPLNSDPTTAYSQHPSLNPSSATTPYYPNSRTNTTEPLNPPSSGSTSSRSRPIPGSASSSSGTHSSSHSHASHSSSSSNSSANRKRSISISPSVSSGYISWDGKACKTASAEPIYSEQTYVSGILGDDHNHPPPRTNPRSYTTGPVYPQPLHPHHETNVEHYEERHYETHPRHNKSTYPSSHFYPDRSEAQQERELSGPSGKRAKKSRESIGEVVGHGASGFSTPSRHTAP